MTRLLISIASLTLLAAPLAAQDSAFYVKGGLTLSQGDSRDMTQNGHGTTVEVGTVLTPSRWDGLQARLYTGVMTLKGDSGFRPWVRADVGNGPEYLSYAAFQALPADTRSSATILEQKFAYDIRGTFVGADIVWPFSLADRAVSVFTGPSLHQWFVDRLNPAQAEADRAFRAGWRLGVTCQVAAATQLELTYVHSEWRSKDVTKMPYEKGANPSRPGYLSMTASYRF